MVLKWQRLDGRDGHGQGRALLRAMTGREDAPEVAPGGKPYYPGGPHFSISHTKTHVFVAVSEKNIGLDAENAGRRVDLRLAERWLSPAEKARFLRAENPEQALLRLWVLKEALAKLTGRGWGNWLRDTDFDPMDARITTIDGCFVAVLEEGEHNAV